MLWTQWLFTLLLGLACGLGLDTVGLIQPVGEDAVDVSVPNLGEYADYSFRYSPTNTIPVGGFLKVTFPQQFQIGLGVAGSPKCVGGTCALSQLSVTVTLTQVCLAAQTCTITLSGIKNPSRMGGTGPFSLTSYKGANMLDTNGVFGVVGIDAPVGQLATALVRFTTAASVYAGEASSYDVILRSNSPLTVGTWIRLTIPFDSFVFPAVPAYSLISLNGRTLPGIISCAYSNLQVTVSGISVEVPGGTDVGITVYGTNPLKEGLTGTFTVETGRGGTKVVYARLSGLSGLTISPGRISGISLTSVDPTILLATSKVIQYTLKFTLKNTVEAGGSILIVCSSLFNMDGLSNHWVNSGLTDISVAKQVTMAYSVPTKVMTVTGFATYTGGEISMNLEMRNPVPSGKTTPLVIQSYRPDGKTKIDEDKVSAYVIVSTTSAPGITVNYLGTTQATGTNLQLQFNFTPQVKIPALGFIKFRIPAAFTIAFSPLTCVMKPLNVGLDVPADCSFLKDTITVQLFASTLVVPAGTGDFNLGVTSLIQITNGLNAPTTAGPYVFDVSTHSTTGTLLESGTVNIDITGASYSTVSITSAHSLVSAPTVLRFAFVPLIDVPASQSQKVTLTAVGAMEFQLETMDFSNNLQFALDLGIGMKQGDSVPCLPEQGVVGTYNGSNVQCVLTTQPANPSSVSFLVITMTDFQAIKAGTNVVVSLPGFYMSQTAGAKAKVRVSTYSVTNRVRLDLNTSIMLLTPTPTALGTPSTDGVSTFTSTALLISSLTTLSGSVLLATITGATNTVLMLRFSPTHGTGYCAGTAPEFSCAIDAVLYPCVCYPTADQLLISLGAFSLTAVSHTFVLKSLQNPDTVPATPDQLTVYSIDNGDVKDIVSFTNTLPAQTPGKFTQVSIAPSTMALGAVHVSYTVKMQSSRPVPQNGSYVVTFPGVFVFQNSSPTPFCTVTSLTAMDSGGVTCTAYNNVVTVSNFAYTVSNAYVQWEVIGVHHPATGSSSGPFVLETRSQYGLTIESYTDAGFTYTAAFAAGVMGVSKVTPLPSNAGALAEYAFELVLANLIGAGGTLLIAFPPAQFPVLPNPPVCRVRAATNSLASCVTIGTSITITFDQDCAASTLYVFIFNVRNPSTSGLTNLFSVSSKYDGVTLDDSSLAAATSTPPKALIQPTAPVLQVNKIEFTPQNEGEKATYTVVVTPTVNITAPYYLTITFPQTYDKRIGDVLRCWANSGYVGNLDCVVTSAYQLQVQGNDAFTACFKCAVSVSVYGVQNPQKSPTSNTGLFAVGVLADGQYSEFTDQAAALDLLDAPLINSINNLTLSNFDVRAANLMKFNMTTTSAIPMNKYQGAVWVVFPEDYMWEGTTPQCTSSSYWAGGAPQCALYFDTVKVWGSIVDYVGTLILSLLNVPNPQLEMKARSIIVKTYDGFNSRVLDSSYFNLSPTSYTYTYPGPLITINHDAPITVQRGTATEPVPITLSYPCALNLTLTPALEGFTVTPSSIDLGVGQNYAEFRVSTPVATATKNFTMIWSMTGEAVPRFYTPLAKVRIVVVSSQTFKMTVDPIDPVPVGGTSVPVRVVIPNPPDLDVTLEMALDETLLGVSLNPDQLHFMPGDTVLYFTISVDASLKTGSGEISLKLSGSNAAAYSLSAKTLSFSIVQDKGETPIVSIASKTVKKASAELTISGTTMGTAYFMCAYAGTDVPSFDEVKTGGPAPYLSTRSLYGHVHLHANKTSVAAVSDLIAARYYTVYAYLQDPMGRVSDVSLLTFATRPLAVPISTSVRVLQSSLNDVEIDLTMAELGLVLAAEDYRIPVLTVTPSTQTNTTTVQFAIVDSPFSDLYLTPLQLLAHIDKNRTLLKKRITNYDDQYDILGVPATTGSCQFSSPPILGALLSDTTISISAQLEKDGEIAAIAVTNESTATPYPWQVELSFSPENLPVSGLLRKITGKTVLNDTLTGLSPDTGYSVYLACGNSNPTFAEMMDNLTVLQVITLPSVTEKKLNLNTAAALALSILALLM